MTRRKKKNQTNCVLREEAKSSFFAHQPRGAKRQLGMHVELTKQIAAALASFSRKVRNTKF